MLKHVASVNIALAGVFVLPGLAGPQDAEQGLAAQLDATVASIDYLGELVKKLEGGEKDALALLLGATEPARLGDLQSEARLVTLRGDVSRLRMALDRMLEQLGIDPNIPGIPGPGSGRTTGSSAAGARVSRSPDQWSPGGLAPTIGLQAGQTSSLKSVLPPLENVAPDAQRRGDEPLRLEQTDFTADAVRQGKLLFRANRHAEAIQLLQGRKADPEAQYWLAQAYRAMDRTPDALEILRPLAENAEAGPFARYAKSDLEFIEFERSLLSRKRGATGGAK
jgi:hypothetical protein